MRRAVGRSLAVALAAALVVVGAGGSAQAHDVLRSTDPADGSTVRTVPSTITLTFDQPALALGSEVVVRTPDGRDAADGEPVLVDTTVQQAVSGELPAGEYEVQWRVTSSDGHPIDGSFTFTATESSGTPASPSAEPSTEPSPTPTATPDVGTAAPTATASPGVYDPGPRGGGPAAWVVGGVIVLVLLGAVAVVVSARRRPRQG